MTGVTKYCRNDKRCSAKPNGPCELWEVCPIFDEINVVAKIIAAREEQKRLQSTAKNKNKTERR